jgi:C_GCAxxG_C_C family probable redox protein
MIEGKYGLGRSGKQITERMIALTKTDDAFKAFEAGYSCSQSVLTAFSKGTGMSEDVSNRIACAFGGGLARRSLTCGAVSGAFMVLGLKYGMARTEDKEAKELTYAKVNEFCKLFIERHGSINCTELLGCDLGTEEGRKYFKEKMLLTQKCNNYVKDACDILTKMGM